MDGFNVQRLAIQFVPFMMAVVFHEFAHGWVAHRWGDNTAQDAGRLTLNPVAHVDPIGTLLFPMIGMLTGINILIGWARPVPINPSRFRKYRPGLFWVSLAGPAMNFILAIFSALVLCAIYRFMPEEFSLFQPLTLMSTSSIYLNFMLGLFNLIPIPPLDGSKIVESFLSYNATRKYESLASYSFFILMALLMTGALNILMYPVLFFSRLSIEAASMLFGIREILS